MTVEFMIACFLCLIYILAASSKDTGKPSETVAKVITVLLVTPPVIMLFGQIYLIMWNGFLGEVLGLACININQAYLFSAWQTMINMWFLKPKGL